MLGMIFLVDVSRTHKQKRFGHGMIEHVKDGAVETQRTADAYAKSDDSDMFDAGIGQHPFQIFLHQNKRNRDRNRKNTEKNHILGDLSMQRRIGNHIDAQYAIKRGI